MKMATNTLTMRLHDAEFRLSTTHSPSGAMRHSLYKVVDGKDSHMKEVESFKHGINYLNNGYKLDWNKFTLFADILHDAVRDVYHLLNFEPYCTTEVSRNIYVTYEGRQVIVRLTMDIDAIGWITNIELTDVEIFDAEVNEMCELFIEDLFKITGQALIGELV